MCLLLLVASKRIRQWPASSENLSAHRDNRRVLRPSPRSNGPARLRRDNHPRRSIRPSGPITIDIGAKRARRNRTSRNRAFRLSQCPVDEVSHSPRKVVCITGADTADEDRRAYVRFEECASRAMPADRPNTPVFVFSICHATRPPVCWTASVTVVKSCALLVSYRFLRSRQRFRRSLVDIFGRKQKKYVRTPAACGRDHKPSRSLVFYRHSTTAVPEHPRGQEIRPGHGRSDTFTYMSYADIVKRLVETRTAGREDRECV